MIHDQNKILFIHIPKTGGSSIEKLFFEDADTKSVPHKHKTLTNILNKFPRTKNYFKFTFVRNPWDITYSMYRWAFKRPTFKKTYPKLVGMTFDQWIKSDYFKSPVLRYINIGINGGDDGSYFDWFVDKKKRSEIDYIGKFEYLQEDFNKICDLAKLERKELPWVNKSNMNGESYRDQYSEQAIQIVRKKYEREIEFFGYEF